jgi:2-polyprenyl-3-methyl-5-hydroxy-6-metoxy-1,4-benzoquinol methylase
MYLGSIPSGRTGLDILSRMMEKSREGTQYDKIARDYASLMRELPINKFGVYPTLIKAIGSIAGKDVVDFACGSGTVTEMLKALGAKRVIGVDDSVGMLRIARTKNREQQLGIEYTSGHIGTLGKIGDFDIVTGGWLLHYATSKEELAAMCRDIAVNLKSGGAFVAINSNPLNPLLNNPKYNATTVPIGAFEEGCELQVTYSIGETDIPFKVRYWKPETYEHALRAAGLTDIEWLPIKPTPEGMAHMGNDFWQDFLEHPYVVGLRAKKP